MLLFMVLWVSYEHFGVSRLRESITLTLTQTNKQQQQQRSNRKKHDSIRVHPQCERTSCGWSEKNVTIYFPFRCLQLRHFHLCRNWEKNKENVSYHRCRRRPSPSVVKLIVFVFPFLVRAPLSPRQKAVPRSKRFNRNRALDAKSYVHLIFITICQISVGRTFIG